MGFEYRYVCSIDEEIIPRYGDNPSNQERHKFMFETRVRFIVKPISGDGERVIDTERYAIPAEERGYEFDVRCKIGLRLKDYWMSNREIQHLISQFGRLAKRTARSRPGVVPVAVDLDVCTLQQRGEAISATAERAMRSEFLPPLHFYPKYLYPSRLYPVDGIGRTMTYLEGKLRMIRVEDADDEAALSVMEVCGLCAGKPIAGTQITELRCGHAFHYHCIVPLLLEEGNSCPVCHQHPAYDKKATGKYYDPEYTMFLFWRTTRSDFDSDDDFEFFSDR